MTTTPADEMRAAASLLREAAGHATPGPWRTHDTHLGSVGGHTATVLTDRENINNTDLVAWLPTMSNEPWDETRNAWRNAGWMALMDPSIGLALADWLEAESRRLSAPDDVSPHALAVARRVLGETTTDTETQADGLRDRIRRAVCEAEGFGWDTGMLEPDEYGEVADAVMAVLPAPADRTDEVENLRTEVAAYRRTLDEADRRKQEYKQACIRLRAKVEQLRADRAAILREAADIIERVQHDRDDIVNDALGGLDRITEAEHRAVHRAAAVLRRLADEAQQPKGDARPGRCPVMFEGGGRCEKDADHRAGRWPDDPHTPQPAPAVTEEPTP